MPSERLPGASRPRDAGRVPVAGPRRLSSGVQVDCRGANISARVSPVGPPGSVRAGFTDLGRGLSRWQDWWTLSWYDVRGRYRRTYLGPWWITLQQIVFVAGLSLLFGLLLGQDLKTYVPYVAIGFLCFTWMTGMLQQGAASITASAAMIKTSPGPISIYSLRVVASATIQFLHDLVVIILVIVIFQVQLSVSLVLFPVAFAVIVVNGLAMCLWLGPLVARYRDVGQVIDSLVRILFFFTPIFWTAADLDATQRIALAGWNPLAYLLNLVRAPLIGEWPSLATLIGCAVITLVNVAIAIRYFSRKRTQLVYWL